MAGWGVLGVVVGLVGIGYLITRKERQVVQTRQVGAQRAAARLPAPSPMLPPASAQALTGEVVDVVRLSETRAQPAAVSHAEMSAQQDVAGLATGFAGEGGSLAGIWGDS